MQIFHEVRHYEDDFMVWHSTYQDMSFLAHWHNEVELIFVREGTARISIDGKIYNISQGDLVICGSRSIHYNDSYKMPNILEFILFDTQSILPEHVDSHESYFLSSETISQLGLSEQVNQIFSIIPDELKNRQTYYQRIVASLITQFWYNIKRKHPHTQTNSEKETTFIKLEKAITYIRLHHSEQITLEKIADIAGFSPSYFSQTFHRLTGIGFLKYLQIVRIDAAIHKLQKENTRILDIALDTGFSNIRSFNRVFKELTGLTPMEFLKKHRHDFFYLPLPYSGNGEDVPVENDSFVVTNNTQRLYDSI